MKTTTNDRPSLGKQAFEIIKHIAKGKHGKDFNTLFNCVHSWEFSSYPVVAPSGIVKRVHARGYKRYLDQLWLTTQDGKKVHVTNQWTHEGFKKFRNHVKKISPASIK